TVPPLHSPEKIGQLRQNIKKLEIALRLDRTEYFPSEDAELIVTVHNPGQIALEVPELFYATMTGRPRARSLAMTKHSGCFVGRIEAAGASGVSSNNVSDRRI